MHKFNSFSNNQNVDFGLQINIKLNLNYYIQKMYTNDSTFKLNHKGLNFKD